MVAVTSVCKACKNGFDHFGSVLGRKYCDSCRKTRHLVESREYSSEMRKDYRYVLKHRIYDSLYYRGNKPEVGFFAK